MLTMAHSPYTFQKKVITNVMYSSTLDVTLASGSQPLNITDLPSPVDIFISTPETPARWPRLTLQGAGNATYAYSPVSNRTNSLGLFLYVDDPVKRDLNDTLIDGEVLVSVFFIQTTSLNRTLQLDYDYVQRAESEAIYKAPIPLRYSRLL